MSQETGPRTSILHLSGGGELSSLIGRQLVEGGLHAEEFADPYLAMGWLAGRPSVRATAAVVDYACLTDDVRDFPRLARGLTSAAAVYLYGDRSSLESDPAISRCGVRTVTTSQQVQQMVTELERLVGGEPAESPPDHQAGEAAPSELHVVGPASQVPNPKADALAEAAAQRWPNPVLDLVETEEEPIAKILPDAEQEESPEEVPTPWSPSAKRPERTPPQAPAPEGRGEARPPQPSPGTPAEPILTPEELEALLGRRDRA